MSPGANAGTNPPAPASLPFTGEAMARVAEISSGWADSIQQTAQAMANMEQAGCVTVQHVQRSHAALLEATARQLQETSDLEARETPGSAEDEECGIPSFFLRAPGLNEPDFPLPSGLMPPSPAPPPPVSAVASCCGGMPEDRLARVERLVLALCHHLGVRPPSP